MTASVSAMLASISKYNWFENSWSLLRIIEKNWINVLIEITVSPWLSSAIKIYWAIEVVFKRKENIFSSYERARNLSRFFASHSKTKFLRFSICIEHDSTVEATVNFMYVQHIVGTKCQKYWNIFILFVFSSQLRLNKIAIECICTMIFIVDILRDSKRLWFIYSHMKFFSRKERDENVVGLFTAVTIFDVSWRKS